jgi:hypothetical protein
MFFVLLGVAYCIPSFLFCQMVLPHLFAAAEFKVHDNSSGQQLLDEVYLHRRATQCSSTARCTASPILRLQQLPSAGPEDHLGFLSYAIQCYDDWLCLFCKSHVSHIVRLLPTAGARVTCMKEKAVKYTIPVPTLQWLLFNQMSYSHLPYQSSIKQRFTSALRPDMRKLKKITTALISSNAEQP